MFFNLTLRFNQQINLFQVIDNNKYIYCNLVEVNLDTLSQLLKLDINFDGLDIEGVKNCLKNKEKKPFSVIYDFLEFQRKKTETQEKIAKLKNDENFFVKLKTDCVLEAKLKKIKHMFYVEKEVEETNWRIGITCQKDCFYILTEILKSLQNNGYEWKVVSSSYKIKGRKRASTSLVNGGSNGHGNGKSVDNALIFLIQIFKVKFDL